MTTRLVDKIDPSGIQISFGSTVGLTITAGKPDETSGVDIRLGFYFKSPSGNTLGSSNYFCLGHTLYFILTNILHNLSALLSKEVENIFIEKRDGNIVVRVLLNEFKGEKYVFDFKFDNNPDTAWFFKSALLISAG